MNPPRSSKAQLNYFQQSPVRGQLEIPTDEYAKTGWRYLQCTDTPNEMRVLLPPRTAQLYAQLLRMEVAELAKDKSASWDRIVQIRHLKDRMIRKCQRLVRESVPRETQGVRVAFHTVLASPDFRLKEMERWFRDQGAEITQPRAESSPAPYWCSKCSPQPAHASHPPVPVPRRGQSMSRRAPSTQVGTTSRPVGSMGYSTMHRSRSPSPSPHKRQTNRLYPSQTSRATGRVPVVVREEEHIKRIRPPGMNERRAVPRTRVEAYPTHEHAKSPEPLPIPHRPREPHVDSPSVVESSPDEDELPSTSPSPPSAELHVNEPFTANGQALPTIHEKPDAQQAPEHRPLPRRRSSLKKSTSMSRLSVVSQTKSVAWAMDRDWIEQMSKYVKASGEAEVLSHELEELRAGYHERLEVMKGLCRDVTAASERVHQEMEVLHRSEEAVRTQENKLMLHNEQLEEKEAQLQAKLLAVLEETKRVVQLCDKKRDTHDT
ncbi:hypothetical protein BKA93DRAFT_722613 [Sparassis latifolia]